MIEVFTGIISGIVSGLGMGGGTILILIFTIFLNIEQHIAQATNLIFFIPTAIIAIYINNRADEKIDYENSIKEMYIDNIRYANLESGNASLLFKNVADFGKMTYSEDNVIQDKLEYKVLNDGDMDYSKPQIYADASNPIILEYANRNIKENSILSDISTDLIFDGTLLRKTGVILSTVKCTLSFDITIVNYYNQEFVANVYIDIPLEDTDTGKTIYDGKFVKKLENTNLIKFFRVK